MDCVEKGLRGGSRPVGADKRAWGRRIERGFGKCGLREEEETIAQKRLVDRGNMKYGG